MIRRAISASPTLNDVFRSAIAWSTRKFSLNEIVARRAERADLRFLADGDVAVHAQIPHLAQRLEADANLRKKVARLGARAVRPEVEAGDPLRFEHKRRPAQPAESDAQVVAHAVDVAERHLAVEEGDRVLEVGNLHRADVEIAAAVLAVAFGVVTQPQQRAELLREEVPPPMSTTGGPASNASESIAGRSPISWALALGDAGTTSKTMRTKLRQIFQYRADANLDSS